MVARSEKVVNTCEKVYTQVVTYSRRIIGEMTIILHLIVIPQLPFSQKFVTILLTFSLKIILRQFLSPFHKDYLTTNFNLTTKITLTIKNSSLGVLDTTLCDTVCQ